MKLTQLLKRFFFWLPLAASAGTLLLKMGAHSNPKKPASSSFSIPSFQGHWHTLDGAHSLEIRNLQDLSWNGARLKVTLETVASDKIVLRDRYGFALVIQKTGTDTLVLFDEADEHEYAFQLSNSTTDED